MIINCTPHDVVVQKSAYICAYCGASITGCSCGVSDLQTWQETLPKSGIVPRVTTTEVVANMIDGFAAVTQSTGDVEGLPEPKSGVFFLVSGMVFAATSRVDVVAPDTGKSAIRNEAGQIVAVTRLLRK